MAEKLSWTELRRALADRSGVSEKEANAFLTAFSGQLVEALRSDKQVKINGLGIFKLQAVAPRKSVDVSTGEEITIEGYNKIVFAPESGVKELIEKSTAVSTDFESADQPTAVDPIKKLGAQAEEIVDILGDLGQSPKEEDIRPVTPEPEIIPEPEPEPVPEPVQEPEPEPIPEPEPEPAPAPEPEPIPEPEPVVEPQQTYIPQPQPQPQPQIIVQKPEKNKFHFLLDVLLCVIILLLLLFGAYFFFKGQISGWVDNMVQPKPVAEEVDANAVPADTLEAQPRNEQAYSDEQEALIPEGTISQEQIFLEFLEASGELDEITKANGQELEYAGWITVEPIHEGSRLTWMSKRFYGAKIYWPYLYDANRDRLTNPNIIDVGTPIRVPRLTATQRDTTNAQTRATLERLKKQAEAAMR